MGIIDNTKEQADVIFKTIGDALIEKYGAKGVIVQRKEHYTKAATPIMLEAMAREVDVAITGLGVKAPGGLTVDEFWTALLAGRGLAGEITRFDASTITTPCCSLLRTESTRMFLRSCARRWRRSSEVAHSATAVVKEAMTNPPISSSQMSSGSKPPR